MSDKTPRRERFIFPDGTALEIVVFSSSPRGHAGVHRATRDSGPVRDDPPAPHADGARLVAAPGVCSRCASDLLYPEDWERNRDGDWNVVMRCPDCEAHIRIVLGREAVEELNRTLYRHAQAFAREADHLSRRNFEEEAEKLVRALARDLILPMDF
jgi:RNase P subunit RPR2